MVKFSRRARADIRGIWSYTIDYWGKGQAQIYLALIEQAVDNLADHGSAPGIGDEIQKGEPPNVSIRIAKQITRGRLPRKPEKPVEPLGGSAGPGRGGDDRGDLVPGAGGGAR